MPKETIATDEAPPAAGAYSQATQTNDFVFTAGQIALTPEGDSLADESITVQTEQALENLTAVLDEAGVRLRDVVKTTVFLRDIDDFEAMNAVYAEFFDEDPPARSAVQAADLPLDMAIEIEAIAAR